MMALPSVLQLDRDVVIAVLHFASLGWVTLPLEILAGVAL